MKSVPVSDGIHWVGAIDWNLRDFHGYDTPRGTTYNAYVVCGADKVALVDTVKTPFVPELLERVADVVPLDKIDYIVVNHVEPDHNSGLRAVMEAIPQAKVVASSGGVRGIAGYHGKDISEQVSAVGADDVIDLGGKTLRFMPMPMVHWPDSMFTYCAESGTLMPNDAFGQHIASSARFADEVGLEFAVQELTDYYANILQPLGPTVAKAVTKVVEAGWICDVIAPSHGVIWRHDSVPAVIDAYDRLTAGETEDKLVVAYCTMWGSTDIIAREIADGAARRRRGRAPLRFRGHAARACNHEPPRRARAASRQPDAAPPDALPDCGLHPVHRGTEAPEQARRRLRQLRVVERRHQADGRGARDDRLRVARAGLHGEVQADR